MELTAALHQRPVRGGRSGECALAYTQLWVLLAAPCHAASAQPLPRPLRPRRPPPWRLEATTQRHSWWRQTASGTTHTRCSPGARVRGCCSGWCSAAQHLRRAICAQHLSMQHLAAGWACHRHVAAAPHTTSHRNAAPSVSIAALPACAGFHGALGHGDYGNIEAPKTLCLGYAPCAVSSALASRCVAGAHKVLSPVSCPGREAHDVVCRCPAAGFEHFGGGDHSSSGGLRHRPHSHHLTALPAVHLGPWEQRRAGTRGGKPVR